MRSIVAVAAGVAALAACAKLPERPMAAPTAEGLGGREIRLSQRQGPGLAITTVGKVMGGGALFEALGGAPWSGKIAEASKQVAEQNKVADPAEQIAAELGNALAARFGAQVNATRVPLKGDDAAEAKAAGAADLVLDVSSRLWGFTYFLSDPSKYRAQYMGRARLIDAKSGRVVAEGHCVAPRAGDAGAAPTYRELVDSGAARMKKELAQVAEYCAAHFASRLFSFDIAQYRSGSIAAAKVEPQAPAQAVTRAATLEANKALPAAGTVWNYRYHDRKFSKRERDFSVQLALTAGTSVTETFSSGGEQQTYSSNSREVHFAVRRLDKDLVYELSPYLLAHLAAPSAASAQPPAYPGEGPASQWRLRVTDVEREPVEVPAGRYEAVRLRITGENPSLLHGVSSAHALQMAASDYRTQRFEYTVWYVPEIGRYVQSRHQTYNRLGNLTGDQWVQLSSVEHPEPRR